MICCVQILRCQRNQTAITNLLKMFTNLQIYAFEWNFFHSLCRPTSSSCLKTYSRPRHIKDRESCLTKPVIPCCSQRSGLTNFTKSDPFHISHPSGGLGLGIWDQLLSNQQYSNAARSLHVKNTTVHHPSIYCFVPSARCLNNCLPLR